VKGGAFVSPTAGFSRFFLVAGFRQTLIGPVDHIIADRRGILLGKLLGERDHARVFEHSIQHDRKPHIIFERPGIAQGGWRTL
jgi:hypothetical protein